MKTRYMLIIVAVAVIFGLTGCPGSAVFNPFLGGTADAAGDATTEQALVDATNATESASEAADGFPFRMTSASGPLDNLINQLITVVFTQGMVDLDAATGQIPGLSIYPLADGALATDPYVRGTALAYSAIVIPGATNGSEALLTVDLTSLTTDLIEIAADPATITANNLTKMLNEDQDDVMGEVEDAEFAYITVTGPAASPVGEQRTPRQAIGVDFDTNPITPTGFTEGSLSLTIPGFDVFGGGLYMDQFTVASIGAGITLWKLDPAAGTWSAVAEGTRTYDTLTGLFTIPLSVATVAGEIYQARYDRYNIATANAVRGFIQRNYYKQNDNEDVIDPQYNLTRTNLEVIDDLAGTAVEYATVASADDNGWNVPQISITVVFGGGVGTGDIVTSTITQDSVKFFFNDGSGLRHVPWEFFAVTVADDGLNEITFWLPVSVDPDSNDDYRVVVSTAVMADAGANPDVPVLATGEKLYGITSIDISNP